MNKQGRKPISEKHSPVSANDAELFNNVLTLDAELKKELDEQGLMPRWVDAKKLYEHQGFHKQGWVPYKRKAGTTMGSTEFKLGNDPDGIVRRGTLILATKTKEQHSRHKNYLDHRAAVYASSVNKDKANELRRMISDKQDKSTVLEGYEENE